MNNKNIEIERKFLVRDDSYKSQAVRKHEIVQGYLCKEHGRTVRVRIRDHEAFLTIKGRSVMANGERLDVKGSGIAHFEWEKAIEVEDAKQLLRLALPGLIEKTRWIVPAVSCQPSAVSSQLVWEVDEFHGALEGFVMAEIELEEENQAFEKPAFIGDEVTGDPRYNNSRILEAFGKVKE